MQVYVQELPKAQPAVVLVLKRLRRRGNRMLKESILQYIWPALSYHLS